jgi:hypothetical protein
MIWLVGIVVFFTADIAVHFHHRASDDPQQQEQKHELATGE